MIQSFRRDNRRGGSRGYGYSCWAVLLGFGSLARPPPSLNPLSFGSEGRSSTLILSSLWASERERERGMKQGRERKTSDPPPTLLCVAACHCLPACIPVSRTVLSAFGTVNGEPTTLLIFLNVIICQPCMLIVQQTLQSLLLHLSLLWHLKLLWWTANIPFSSTIPINLSFHKISYAILKMQFDIFQLRDSKN